MTEEITEEEQLEKDALAAAIALTTVIPNISTSASNDYIFDTGDNKENIAPIAVYDKAIVLDAVHPTIKKQTASQDVLVTEANDLLVSEDLSSIK
ncbi:hypothetical protein ABG067_009468, partial [Albugo candida]